MSQVQSQVKTFGNLIGDREVGSEQTFASRNASELSDVLGHFPEATKEQVREACLVAREAFRSWSKTPAPVRGELIGTIGKALEREKEALSRLATREMGKTLKEARGDVQEAIDTCHFFQSEGRRLYGQTVPSEMPNKDLLTYRRPLGVVGVVTAGNFPVAVPAWKLIPALLTGNTVVWKPSEDAPACAYALVKLMHEAGLPAGVLNLVFGGGKGGAGEHLIAMMDEGLLNKFAFTGSTAVGREIGAIAGRNLLHPTLELGGKNPLVVMRDADLGNAVAGALWASFGTGGQRCTSAGNLILDAPIYDAFKARFLEATREIKIGDPNKHEDVLYGPFISKKFFERWLEHYAWGHEDGATKLYGEGRITPDNRPEGFVGDPEASFYGWPTVWEGVTPEMRLFKTEIFGPTINLVKVDGFDEAIATANAVDYGLSSAIYTNNRLWAHRFKEEIQAGMTSINNSTTGAEAHMPFGGIKGSGNGTRESGIWVIDNYTYWHGVNDDVSGKLQLAQMDTAYIAPKAPVNVTELFA
ncbi:aldehyde dehydrogenase family protein [Truepera radiovictrix]|uniref:Aldehyde Dehydrogenase n=1 Tax=Truepera radiovictrix (strain DSM 17093 / CIP 108686 / LMG 22925 / RQ-24) TaxID=649638 RepID=D7CS11_TRURR|nr:Aldehyde Dehydrogenase [Truepera radiovictrix DSM 17093]